MKRFRYGLCPICQVKQLRSKASVYCSRCGVIVWYIRGTKYGKNINDVDLYKVVRERIKKKQEV